MYPRYVFAIFAVGICKATLLDYDMWKKMPHPRWAQYRLGDYIKGYNNRVAGCETYPKSIVCDYSKRTHTSNNITILDAIVTERAALRHEDRPTHSATLHVRLGDAFHYTDAAQCWYHNHCFHNSGGTPMLYPQQHYVDLMTPLRRLHVTTVVIVSCQFMFMKFPGSQKKSIWYHQKVIELFESEGFQVIVRDHGLPDDDFVFMSTSPIFIQGGGGFSRFVSKLVSRRGGIVMS